MEMPMSQLPNFRNHRRWLPALIIIVLLAADNRPAQAELDGPGARDHQVARAVTLMLRRDHLSRQPLDDQMSQRCLTNLLRSLDPMKLYFDQADVDKFSLSAKNLDDQLKKGDVSFAHDVYNVYLQRVKERVALASAILAQEHDFTVDEVMVNDAKLAQYAQNSADAENRWRKRVKYDLLRLKLEDVEGDAAREKLLKRYNSLQKRAEQTSNDELLEMYLTALTSSFDPHTSYMSPQTLDNFEIVMKLELEGIGAALQSTDGETVISKIIPGGAADQEGSLEANDKIIGVSQDGQEYVDTLDMKLSDVVNLIRGQKDTQVHLKYIRGADANPRTVAITRAKIELKDSEARGEVIEQGNKPDGTPYKVGVIELPSFYMDMSRSRLGRDDYKSTTRDVKRLLDQFNSDGVDAVVLDLRRNGGGALEEAIKLTGLFIDQGPVVQVKNAFGEVEVYPDTDPGVAWDGPLVVLISKFSASASEILAGAIQDYGRGIIVGDQATHGKGTVQSLKDLSWELFRDPNGKFGALKITMQQFYRPNGDSTQNRGVISDVELPSLTTHFPVGESDLDFAMEFDQVEPASYKSIGLVDSDVVEQLRQRSLERQKNDKDFQKTLKRIESYLAQKNRKTVPLKEETFMTEREELDSEEEELSQLEEKELDEGQVVKRDYYFNEALAITLDLLQLTSSRQMVLSGK